MAQVKFEKECVKFCISCGSEFEKLQPETSAENNIISCDGCKVEFVARTTE